MKALKRVTQATMWLLIVAAGSLNLALAQQGATVAPVPLPPAPPVAAPTASPTPSVTTVTTVTMPAATETVTVAAEKTAEGIPASDTVSMEVTDAKIQDILRALAAMRPGTQIIMTPDVQGNVSFSLKEAPWELALKLVTESNGFQYTRVGENIFKVSKLSAQATAEVTIELLEKSDVARVPDEDAIRLALVLRPTAQLPPALAREELARNPQRFVKLLQVENRPAIEVVTALARKANLNFTSAVGKVEVASAVPAGVPGAAIAAPPGGAPVTLSLRYLSIEDAMKLVAAQGGLQCLQQSGVWTVKLMPAQATPQEPLKMETLQVQFLPVDEELVKMLTKFLTERGKVSANKNKIIIRDTAESIENVRNALAIMDTPTPQVVIEARFFSLNKGDDKNLGLDWSSLGKDGVAISGTPLSNYQQNVKGTYTSSTGNGPNTSGATASSSISTDVATGAVTGAVTNGTTSAIQATSEILRQKTVENVHSAILDVAQFGTVLHALVATLKAKQLSNPKVVVSSDQQATIHIGDQTPIIKSTTQQSGGTGGALQTFELDPDYGGEMVQEEQLLAGGTKTTSEKRSYTARKGYLDLGTKLTVAPSVKTEDQIYIKVVPQLTTLVRYETYGTGISLVRYPVLFSTEVRTEFTIRSGQTIAIGGLVSEQESVNEKHVPFLGSIPLIGRLFSYEAVSKSETETIIFLTVKVVSAERLTGASAIPVRAKMVSEELDRIMKEDAAGAEFNPDQVRTEMLKQKAADEEAKRPFWQAKKAAPAAEIVPATKATAAPTVPAVAPAAVAAPAAATAGTEAK